MKKLFSLRCTSDLGTQTFAPPAMAERLFEAVFSTREACAELAADLPLPELALQKGARMAYLLSSHVHVNVLWWMILS